MSDISPRLVGPTAAAALLGIGRERLRQLRRDKPDFPAIRATSARGPEWDAGELLAWNRARLARLADDPRVDADGMLRRCGVDKPMVGQRAGTTRTV